jgi:hypothetical protein
MCLDEFLGQLDHWGHVAAIKYPAPYLGVWNLNPRKSAISQYPVISAILVPICYSFYKISSQIPSYLDT